LKAQLLISILSWRLSFFAGELLALTASLKAGKEPDTLEGVEEGSDGGLEEELLASGRTKKGSFFPLFQG
jgi:hypothetical protein